MWKEESQTSFFFMRRPMQNLSRLFDFLFMIAMLFVIFCGGETYSLLEE